MHSSTCYNLIQSKKLLVKRLFKSVLSVIGMIIICTMSATAQSQDTARSEILELYFYPDIDKNSKNTDIPVVVTFKIRQYQKLSEVRYVLKDSADNLILADTSNISAKGGKYYNERGGKESEVSGYEVKTVFILTPSQYKLLRKVDVSVIESNNSNKKVKTHQVKK